MGSATSGDHDQSDAKAGGARWSYSFVNLKCNIRTRPGGLSYHNCRQIRSTGKSIDKKYKKTSYDSCRTTGQKVHTCLSARKWSQCGTIFQRILIVSVRESGPYPASRTEINAHIITNDSESDGKIRCARTHHEVGIPNHHLGMVVPDPRQFLRRRNWVRTRREFRKWRSGIAGEITRIELGV